MTKKRTIKKKKDFALISLISRLLLPQFLSKNLSGETSEQTCIETLTGHHHRDQTCNESEERRFCIFVSYNIIKLSFWAWLLLPPFLFFYLPLSFISPQCSPILKKEIGFFYIILKRFNRCRQNPFTQPPKRKKEKKQYKIYYT